jgi:hypothetical protein
LPNSLAKYFLDWPTGAFEAVSKANAIDELQKNPKSAAPTAVLMFI